MRKLTMLSLFALLVVAVGCGLRRLLGPRESEWHTVASTTPPSAPPYDAPPATPTPPTPASEAEPADLYDVEPEASMQADATIAEGDQPEAGDAEAVERRHEPTVPPRPFDPLTDPLPEEDL